MHFLLLLSCAVICPFGIAEINNCRCIPPNFPEHMDITRQDYINFLQTVKVKDLWTAFPQSPSDVVILANWAKENNYKIRARGRMRSWSPITVDNTTNCTNTLLVDIIRHLKSMSVYPTGIENYNFPVIRVEAGATLEELLVHLESHNFGLPTTPAIGNATIGGLFAIGAHGSSVPVVGSLKSQRGYGIAANRIVKIDAVTWDEEKNGYSLRTYDRSDYEISALMTHIGQAFITSYTLRVEENFYLSCTIRTDIPNKQLFADPELGPQINSLSSLTESTGRIAIFSYPFLNNSLIIQCREVLSCPKDSQLIAEPYLWLIQDLSYINWFTDFFSSLLKGSSLHTLSSPKPSDTSSPSTDCHTYCGLSKNLLLYAEITDHPSTFKVSQLAYPVLLKRENMQKVIHKLQNKLYALIEYYKSQGKHPLVGLLEFRETGLDDPSDIAPNARSSFLASTTKPISHPEFDTVLYFDYSSFDPAGSNAFFTEFESYFQTTFNGTLGLCRPHFAKSWGFSEQGPYTNQTLMNDMIPSHYDYWDEFMCAINKMDPYNIFTNNFIDRLFVPQPNYTCKFQ